MLQFEKLKNTIKRFLIDCIKIAIEESNWFKPKCNGNLNLVYNLSKENIIHIPTGRMPKAKAEEYIKSWIIKIREKFPETKNCFFGYDQFDDYKTDLISSVSTDILDDAYIVFVQTGRMPLSKVDEYLKNINENKGFTDKRILYIPIGR